MKRSYKQKYEELLIKKHEKKYIHISFSWKGIARFFALIGSLGLAIANFMLIISTWKLLNLGDLTKENITGFHQLLIIYPIIGEYILIGLTVICLTALIKGGFDKLKGYDGEGLIFGLTVGLIGGLLFGLSVGLLFGLSVGLLFGLTVGLLFGLTVGLIGTLLFGLTGGLLFGLTVGFDNEFERWIKKLRK